MPLVDSAYAKLDRAREHLAELQTAVDAFREQDLSSLLSTSVEDHPSDPSLAVVGIRMHMQAPMRWSLIIGDILTNLRAALDHAVYGHASARQQLNSSQRRDLKYPIFTERRDWDGIPDSVNQDGTIRRGLRGAYNELEPLLAPEVLTLIGQAQPFEAQIDPPEWHALAILNGLVNRDKHRAVHEIPINIANLAVTETELEIISQEPAQLLPDGSIEAKAVLRRPARPPGAEPRNIPVNFAGVTEFMEHIELPRVDARKPFLTVMEKLVDAVAGHLDELRAAGC
jgi:hypothetical protein